MKPMRKNSLKGKVVWITGGKRIGQSIALELARLGANIVISYRSSIEEAEEATKKIKSIGGKSFIIECDVSRKESVAKAVKEIVKKWKRIDTLILLASVFKPVDFSKIEEKDLDINIATHIKGTFWPIQTSKP